MSNELKEYQKEMIELINSDVNSLISIRTHSKALYNSRTQEFVNQLDYVLLEDHWEYPGLKRVDVTDTIKSWIETHDISTWCVDVNDEYYTRMIIQPELLTLLQLKFSNE